MFSWLGCSFYVGKGVQHGGLTGVQPCCGKTHQIKWHANVLESAHFKDYIQDISAATTRGTLARSPPEEFGAYTSIVLLGLHIYLGSPVRRGLSPAKFQNSQFRACRYG